MIQVPHGPNNLYCPLWRKRMSTVCHTCPLWTQVRGPNPQGGEIDEWNCALSFLPVLLVDNTQQQRQTGAAVESFRNEMVKANHQILRLTDDRRQWSSDPKA